jgi:hypothetical protein
MPSNPTEPAASPRGSVRASLLPVLAVLAVTLALLLLVEGLASVLMSVRAARHTLNMQEEAHTVYDADLGWRHRPGLRINDLYGPGTPFTVNAQGLRGTEDYRAAAPPGRYRVVLLGDSFTMGYGVGDADTYPARLQAACPVLQAVNMGQGGYGLDQAYLWHRRDGAALNADLLVLAVIAHDFFRMASDQFIGYGKPVLSARGGRLTVGNVPVPQTWHARRLSRQAGALVGNLAVVEFLRWLGGRADAPRGDVFAGTVPDEVMAAAALAIDDLAQHARAAGRQFVLVYLPIAEDLLRAGPSPEAAWMAGHAGRAGLAFIDLTPPMRELPAVVSASLFRPADGHYSVAGNRYVAEALRARLPALVPGFPACAG